MEGLCRTGGVDLRMGVVVVEMEVRPTIGILVPSLSLRLGIGVWMLAILVGVVGLVAGFVMCPYVCNYSRL